MISIITSTLNSAATLEKCLLSITEQGHHARIEHIVIDGVSTDGTLEIADHIPVLLKTISEPDQGLYDAINKGLKLATGDIIGILNADDFYANPNVLEKVNTAFENQAINSCYGDLIYVDRDDISRTTRYWKAGPYNYRNFYWGWMPPHPTFFVRRTVYEKYGMFNLSLGSAADYELMLRFLVKHRITAAYIPEVIGKDARWRDEQRIIEEQTEGKSNGPVGMESKWSQAVSMDNIFKTSQKAWPVLCTQPLLIQ